MTQKTNSSHPPSVRPHHEVPRPFPSAPAPAVSEAVSEAPSEVAARTSAPPPSRRSLPPPSSAVAAPILGAILRDTYVIDRRVGEGGMSQIYEAHHCRLSGRKFAIKILRARLAKSLSIRDRFQTEIRAVASISHSAVVGVFDYGTTSQGWPYMVSEFYDGLDIRACLQKYGRLGVPAVLEIGRVLGEALVATHAQGVIHRDLKPSNVFLVGDFSEEFPALPEVKLLDFGLSRFLQVEARTTASGLILGTPSYMAPEQAHGQGGDELSDVYGLGAVLYAAVTGEAPFAGETVKETLLMVMTRKPIRPGKLCPSISEGLEVVIQRAMARDPRDRYRNMKDMVLALANLQGLPTSAKARARASALVPPAPRLPVRLQLCGWLVAATAFGSAVAVASCWGLGQLVDVGSKTDVQYAMGLGWVLGASALGAVVWLLGVNLRHFRRSPWADSSRLATWVPQIRRLLGAGLMGHATGALVVTLVAAYGGYSATAEGLGANGLSWPGWQPLLAEVALIWIAVAAIEERARAKRSKRQGTAPRWSAALILCVAALSSSAVLAAGWAWPGGHIFVSPSGLQR